MLTSSSFGTLISPVQRKIFIDELNNYEPQYKQIFHEVNITTPSYPMSQIGGFGEWSTSTEGSAIPTEDIKQEFSEEIKTDRYAKGYSISWELMQDDQQGVFNGTNGNDGCAKSLAKSLQATIERVAASSLTRGFTEYGQDSEFYFSDAHKYHNEGTETGSNKLTSDLTVDGLKAACKLMRQQKDYSGETPFGALPGTLIVHSDDEFTARAIVGSGINIINGIPTAESSLPNLQVVVLDYLEDDTSWFLKARNVDNLIMVWREKPAFSSHQIPQSLDWFFYGHARFGARIEQWRGLVAGVKSTT